MTKLGYRGVVRGGIVLLEEKSLLTEGTEVLVTPVDAAQGSAAAILAAADALPKVPGAWVDELENLIAEGRRPPAHHNLFADDQDVEES